MSNFIEYQEKINRYSLLIFRPHPILPFFCRFKKIYDETDLLFKIIDFQDSALPVESHVPYVQFWHTGMTRSLRINPRIRAPLGHNLNIGADMVRHSIKSRH